MNSDKFALKTERIILSRNKRSLICAFVTGMNSDRLWMKPEANKVFVYEDEFRRKAIQMLETRRDRLGEKRFKGTSLTLQ